MADSITELSTRHHADADLSQLRVAVLGAGKMGGILLQAFLKQQILSPDNLFATVGHAEKASVLATQWGIEVSTDNLAIAQKAPTFC